MAVCGAAVPSSLQSMSRYPRIAADVDDEEEAALRAMVPDGMDGDYLMAEVAPSAREGSALTMPPPGRETSVSTAAGQMLPSGAATATALCRACLARGNKWTHTCRKRRNTPAVVSTQGTPIQGEGVEDRRQRDRDGRIEKRFSQNNRPGRDPARHTNTQPESTNQGQQAIQSDPSVSHHKPAHRQVWQQGW